MSLAIDKMLENEAPFSCRHSLNRFSKFYTVEIKIFWGMLRQTLVI